MKLLPIFVTLLPYFANAANDWSRPCFQGTCSYDVAPSDTSMSASMTIGGSTTAISDITPAAGWEIMGCDPNAESQDIRLVCKSSDATSAGCDHLYQNGAENTIVRLPENCLKVPFARVARAWVPADQSIPTSIAHRIMRRDTPQVHALTLDTNWTAAAGNQDGNVTLVVTGSTIPGELGNATITPPPTQRRSRMQPRSLTGILGPITIPFNKNITTTLPPVDVNQEFTLFDTSVACQGTSGAALVVKANTIAHADITLGVVVAGTLVPSSLNQFALTVGLNAHLGAILNLNGTLSGTLDSGLLPLFQVGIPGLNIPRIISLGPVFKLNGRANVNLDVDVNMEVGVDYDVQDLQLIFPPVSGQTSFGSLKPLDAPITLSVSPQVSSQATVEVHVIPTIDVGITAFGGLVASTVFLNVDANAVLGLNLNAQAQGTAQTGGSTSATGNVNGCVDIHTGVTASAGALGSFFSFFDASTTIPILTEDFFIFQKCFGASSGLGLGQRSTKAVRALPFERRDLACPISGIPSTVVSLAEGIQSALNFRAII